MRTAHRFSLIVRRALWLSGAALVLAGLVFALAPMRQVMAARQALVARFKAAIEPASVGAYQDCTSITCPANITVSNTPGQCGANVNFTPPSGPGCGTVTCLPMPNSFFPVGTTTVNCFANACSIAFAVLTTTNSLIFFQPSAPGTVSLPLPILGLGTGENVEGIDFRPANGLLYGLGVNGTTGRLLIINPNDGTIFQVGASFAVSGTAFGFDFNPTVDRLRVVSDTDINLSINPNDGAVTIQTPLNPGNPNVVGSAYTNNFVGATTTTLYAIDSGADTLRIQSPPASGTLSNVGSLGVNTTNDVGFDISQCDGTAYAALTPVSGGGIANLYTINLGTGAATLVGAIGSELAVRGLAIGLASTTPSASCSFTVTVNDTQPPVITCPASFAVGTAENSAIVNYPPPTVSDNCPGVGAPVCAPASGSSFPVGVTTVTCTVADAAGNTASCSFNITVNRVRFSVDDPLSCTKPGSLVTGTFTITNNGAAPVAVAATVALPGGLVALPGSCTANVGSCSVVNSATVTYTNAALGVGQTATVSYQAQVGGQVTPSTILCSNLTVSFGGGPTLTVQACLTVDCPAVGPGDPFPTSSEVSAISAGSALVYNFYTSSATNPNTQDTRVNITNIHPTLSARLHLFFVEGETCSVADNFVCLTPNQTTSFLASELDPGTTGYIVAVSIDLLGCPTNCNFLIGDEYVKLSTGHAANLGAEAFSALAGGLPFCNENSVTAQLNFDGVSYNRAPRVLALDNIPARANGNDTLLVINRFGGDLTTGAATIGPIFGALFNDMEQIHSFTFTPGVCQFRRSLTNSFPRTTPRIETVIPAGHSGWMKLWMQSDGALLGAAINFNPNAATAPGAFNQGHNLHKLTLTSSAVLTIPIFPPNC